jgi:hypothetical protein
MFGSVGGSKIDFGSRCRFKLVLAHPILLKATWYLAHTWGACVLPLSSSVIWPYLQRDFAVLCPRARLEAHWSRAVHVGMLLWFIHLLLFSSFFSDPQRPGLSCYAGGFVAIWQYCILHILGCIFVFYEITNQALKFIYPFGQICKFIRIVMWITQRNNILHDMDNVASTFLYTFYTYFLAAISSRFHCFYALQIYFQVQ